MAKGFSEEEKEQINTDIIEQGRRLFELYGLKKTTIADITRAVHISQGTFYSFYHSKEELYFRILELEESRINQDLEKNFPKDKESIKTTLKKMFKFVDTNPFIQQTMFADNMQGILRKLPEETLSTHLNKDSKSWESHINKWHENGVLLGEEPDIIAALFRAIFLMSLHKKEIGESVYDQTIALLISFVIDGLCSE